MQAPLLMLFASGAAALGVNCRGSGACSLNSGSMQTIKDQVGVLVAEGGRDRRFSSGQQLACAEGSICVFYQNGASGTAQDAYNQLEQLKGHGCKQCGSLPTQPGDDVSMGELTVNFVSTPCCVGSCHC